MNTREQKFRLGLFVIVSLSLLIIALGVFLVPLLQERGAIYRIKFTEISVNGLSEGAPVKYQGVRVGKVDKISVNRDDLKSIMVQVRIDRDFQMKIDMEARLNYAGITGQKFIQLSGGSSQSENLPLGGEISTARGIRETAEDIAANVETAVVRVNQLLAPENQERISNALENLEQGSKEFSDLFSQKRQSLENTITQIETASNDMVRVIEGLEQVVENLNAAVETIDAGTDRTMTNISERFSEEEFGKVIRDLDAFLETAASGVGRIEEQMLRQQGRVDETLLELQEAIENITLFTRQMLEDPTIFVRKRKGGGK